MNKCLFLDRDGTINVLDKTFVAKKEDVKLIDGINKLIHAFRNLGYIVIVISNQGGVGSGYYTEKDLFDVQDEIDRLLALKGEKIDAYYYCYHNEKFGIGKFKIRCNCRKPEIGMLVKAKKDFDIDFSKSFFLGDNITDEKCADNAGIKHHNFDYTFSIPTERGKRVIIKEYTADFINTLLLEAK